MTSIENMVNEFLPQLRAHVIAKYGWLERRGNCLVTIDDLIQVASIALLRHIDRWPRIAADAGMDPTRNNGAFYVMLKEDVKRKIMRYRREADDPAEGEIDPIAMSFDDRPEGLDGGFLGATDEEFRTALHAPSMMPHWKMIQSDVVDYFVFLRKREKMNIALRYFEELSHETTAELLGVSVATSRQTISTIKKEWLNHARNQYRDEQVNLQGRVHGIKWEPSEALVAFLRDRRRMDIDEYLGIVTIAFREDVSYLTEILSETRHYGATAHAGTRALSPYQEAQVDKWMSKGMSQAQIARDLGVDYHHVNQYVRSGRQSVNTA
ncbi:sigma factor-like helix-turn-helix DNA-binding protein [Microbacterium aurum]|uniref:sigma factor-like helix-turn-helix DNA-binding protein n=1 Tax=Microbacterium aurum TaxID=36805 RepID=UPI0028E56EBA|nr:sigma factor-like helix-turn-helix DNA-binding protein [Microbacterium aurum]